MTMKRKPSFFILFFGLLFVAGSSFFHDLQNSSETKENKVAEEVLKTFSTVVEEEKLKLNDVLQSFEAGNKAFLNEHYKSSTNSYYCFQDTTLISWTSNKQSVNNLLELSTGIFEINNSWYVVKRIDKDSLHFFGLSLIEKSFGPKILF